MKRIGLRQPRSSFASAGVYNGFLQNAFLQVLLGASLVAASGCTQGVGDIDRTQPNLFEKSDFEGQWFIGQTVTDVPPTSVASFEGEMGAMELVTWEVQEAYLVGYRAYEFVPGSDERAASGSATVNDQPVAKDLGEGREKTVYKGNPIAAYAIENHVDVRRQYNSSTGEESNVIEENETDRPWYDRAFMRVDWSVNRVSSFLDPELMPRDPYMFGEPVEFASFIPEDEGGEDAFRSETDEDGNVNYIDFTTRSFVRPSPLACASYFNQNSLGDCTDDEIKVRTSLVKVDAEREQDYVPMVYNDQRHGEFGYFRTERATYNRDRGNTYTGLILLANRHEMWDGSRDSSGNPIPEEQRKLRPIVYSLSPGFPADLIETTQEIADEYDAVFKRVAATASGKSVSEIENELATDYKTRCLYCLDRNKDGHARPGDLRYNFITWIDDPQRLGPLGYGPSTAHPETGRIVSGAANVYGAGIDSSAALAKDVVDLLNGDLKESDISGADYVRQAVYSSLPALDPRTMTKLQEMPLAALPAALLGEDGLSRWKLLAERGLPPARPGLAETQLKRVQGTALESLLIPAEEREVFDPTNILAHVHNGATGPGVINPSQAAQGLVDDPSRFSIVNWGTSSALANLTQFDKLASEHCLWLERFSDANVVGLAKEAKDKGLQGDKLLQFLRKEIYRAVMLHELGHTVGLRHNFGGSADTLNFGDEYWPERVKSFKPSDGTIAPWLDSNCTSASARESAACKSQEKAKMAEYQYSTIMDYGGRFNSDFHGLGYYDEAAIASAYGDLVEVFDDEVTSGLDADTRTAIINANNRFSPILGQGIEGSLDIHYTQLPGLFGGARAGQEATSAQVEKGVANLKKRRWIPRSEYDRTGQTGPLKVPYLSCYDEFVDSVETCHRWDIGADDYEITNNIIQRYKEYYVFNNFQRDRVGFSGVQVMANLAGRYFLPLTNMYQTWLFKSFSRQGGTPQAVLGSLAARQGFNLLWNVMATPPYGAYEKAPGSDAFTQVSDQNDPEAALNVAPGEGRRTYSRFDTGSGYNVFRRVLESGHYYDQAAALEALTNYDGSVIGVGNDVQADVLRYRIPYYLVFEKELNTLFGSIYNRDVAKYAPKVREGRLIFKSVFEDEALEVDGYVEAPVNYSTRLLTLLYGTAFFQSSYDMSFVQRIKVAIVGSGEELTPADGFEAVEVQDPLSGRRYVAYQKVGGGDGPWIAAEYLASLLPAVEAYYAMPETTVDEQDAKANAGFGLSQSFEEVELMRSLFHVFEYSFAGLL